VVEHVHACEVVDGDVFFLAVDFADAVRSHLFAHVEQSKTLSRCFTGPVAGFWLSSVTMRERMVEIGCGV
jgi:hypothetical protein